MTDKNMQTSWDSLSHEEKNHELYPFDLKDKKALTWDQYKQEIQGGRRCNNL